MSSVLLLRLFVSGAHSFLRAVSDRWRLKKRATFGAEETRKEGSPCDSTSSLAAAEEETRKKQQVDKYVCMV